MSLNLEKYPTEPLHDLKGHIRNIIDESMKQAVGETKQVSKNVHDTVLNKAILRCSDYHKALVIIYKSLKECSIICHSPLLYRIVCLRSEVQERMFGQAKQITRATSSLKANHIVTNIVTQLQLEAKTRENHSLTIQESEMNKLANTLGPTRNSVIPYSWMEQNPSLHQAHLERISDFLLPGPGVWWKHSEDRIEFLVTTTAHLSSLWGQTYITYAIPNLKVATNLRNTWPAYKQTLKGTYLYIYTKELA